MAKLKVTDPTIGYCIASYQENVFFDLIKSLNVQERSNFEFSDVDYDELIELYLDDIEDSINVDFKPKLGKGREILHVGFDTEYVFNTATERNDILSYQVAIIRFDEKTEQLRKITKVFYPDSSAVSDRFTLEKLVSLIIQFALQEKLIKRWCCQVYLYAHFIRAEFSSMSDFFQYKKTVRGVSNTLAGHANVYGVDMERLASKPIKAQLMKLQDKGRRTKFSIVEFVDTILLTPNKSGLARVGELLNIDKLSIPAPYSIERMDEFLTGDKAAFEVYGLRDAELAVYYGLFMQTWARVELGLKYLPMTLAGCGLAYFKKITPDYSELFGTQKRSVTNYDAGRGISITRKIQELVPERAMYEEFATRCYHGGRNETYVCGVTDVRLFEDMDLKSAYTVAQLGILQPDWKGVYHSKTVLDYKADVFGFARIKFKFPNGTRYPSLPVRTDSYGLIFPLSGVTYVTAPEIEVAVNLNCDVTILEGIIVPFVAGSDPIFLPYTQFIRDNRQKHKVAANKLMETLIKEVGNSTYGKTAQGLKVKNTFDVESGMSKSLPHSDISNPFVAAYTSGLVRAVLSEHIANLEFDSVVTHLTTDGFCSDLTGVDRELAHQSSYKPVNEHFSYLLDKVGGGFETLECKHSVKQLVVSKTRAQYTGMEDLASSLPIILAKGGIKLDLQGVFTSEQRVAQENTAMIDLYLTRYPHQKVANEQFISIREQWFSEKDLISIKRERTLNMEFDCKRQLVNPKMHAITHLARTFEHIYLSTIPFATVDDFMTYRSYFDGWRMGRRVIDAETGDKSMAEGHCLKNLDDL